MNKSEKKVLGVIMAFCILLGLIFVPSLLLYQVVVPPGWEIYDQVCGVEHEDQLYTQSSDFTSPRECKGVYWKVDVDEPAYGVPTMQILMGDMFHVDFSGKPVPASTPASTLTKEVGNRSYYLDLHIFMFTVTIRTIADKNIYKHDGLIVQFPVIEHETSWSHELWDGLNDRGYNDRIGSPFVGGVYEKFVVSPWVGYTYRDPPESDDPDDPYVLEECWAGVMNAYVFEKEMGQIENKWGEMPDPESPYYVKGVIPEGNQVPMFKDDGTFGTPAPTVTWNPNLQPRENIESTIVLYTPIEMMAGCEHNSGAVGEVWDIYPCDVYVMYTLRIDVLTTHGFVLQSAIEPPEPVTPSDFFSWAEGFWESLLGGLNPFAVFGPFGPLVAWLALFLVVAIIILVLLAIFAPWVLAWLGGVAGKATSRLKKAKHSFRKGG